MRLAGERGRCYDLPSIRRDTHRARAVGTALLVLTVTAPSTSPAAGLAVPLAIEETAGVARRSWPVTASVPFPRGRLRGADVWVAAPAGDATLAQARALERWPDGSTRWLLVDFLADVGSHRQVTYMLHDGTAPHTPGGGIRDRDTAAGRVLDTGALRVTVPVSGPTLAELAHDDGAVQPIAAPTLLLDGAPPATPAIVRVAVETVGPVRTELLVTGRYPQGIDYELRLAVFAGEPWVRLQLTITDMADAEFAPVRSLALAALGPFARASLGIDGNARTVQIRGNDRHELRHADAEPAELDGERAGRHGDGWVRAVGDESILTIVARYFWEEYPKAIEVAADRVRLDLFAGRDAPVLLGSGAAKTHELWVAAEPLDRATPPATLAAALQAPLTALPPAGWIVTSRALPQALSPAAPGASDFLAHLATAVARYEANARTERWDDGPPVPCTARTTENPRLGFYGALNWGDWNFPGYRDRADGCDAWGNLEYDLSQVLGLGWAATGSRLFWEALVPAARHYRDVDVAHHAPHHPEWVGFNHPHTALHFTFGKPANVDLGHTWTEGLLTYYRLTGETRALEAARGIADALRPHAARADNPRKLGWPMIALVAVYDATGERRYLEAARTYADAALRKYRPSPAAADWKMGILADGLAAVHAATGDDDIRRWLVTYADTLLASPGRWPDARYALPLGYLAAATGVARYEAAALAVARGLKIGVRGKQLAIAGRTGFRLLAPLAATRGLAAPPRASAFAPPPPSRSHAAPGRRRAR
ncbi:MAG: hypothetical protein E6J56_18430 [Deltaproteobacteria bacterium]|nr:MAG: hypothetical protein E6J56_18430 [Deltaproteobacteria bacterium]